MSLKIRCDHCLLEFNERDAVNDSIGGAGRKFCCAGCRGIYRLINDAGLDDFYTRRDGWSAGPSDAVNTPDADIFAKSVRVSGDGHCEIGMNIGGIRCASCVWLIERMIGRQPGVIEARINYATHSARIRWDASITSLGEILQRVASIGYRPLPADAERSERELEREGRDLLMRFGTAAFFSMQVMMFAAGLYAGYFDGIDPGMSAMLKWIALVLSVPVVTYCAMPFHRSAFRALAHGAFGMDALISAGTIITFLFSVFEILHGRDVYFDSATMIVTFVLMGRYIESRARGSASGAISRLARLQPSTARRIVVRDIAVTGEDSGNDYSRHVRETVSADGLRPGDLVEAFSGEAIAGDGVVDHGECEVDESMLTGEAAPAVKRAGATVIGGTVVASGAVVFRITKNRDETILAGITRAVENALSSKAPVERMADRISSVFVPAVFGLSAISLAASLWRGADVSRAVLTAVSVLVAACPCALGLATPLAVVSAIGRAASRGIIIKGGETLERLRGVKTVLFDKTGTLTTGRTRLSDSIRLDAAQTIRALDGLDTVLLTGDVEAAAMRVARECGIPEYRAGLLPQQKLEIVNERRKSGGVMMVGDGVNDAPALAAADVGVAMASGSDIAFESANIVIVSGRISSVPEALELGRLTWRIIVQNLFWAFAYNAVIIPLAMAGFLHPIMSACTMALSSASVAANSMRVNLSVKQVREGI